MADLLLEDVSKSFGRVPVLHGINLAVADGEMMVVLGPSGCGKSTLLRLVAGLERADSGTIRIGGRVVNALEPKDRDIAMVFQNYALYPHMSVYDNMAYGLRNRRMPKTEIDRRVREAAAILGLSDLLDRKPRQLSGGQRQRVAMGRAIVREPAIFLFDEPLSNLDAKLRVQMRHEIRQLQDRLGTTALYVTHDQVEAMTLGDRLVLLNAGRIEQIGPPLEVYARPQTLFVAGFLGSPPMNVLPATLGEDRASVRIGPNILPLEQPLAHPAGSELLVGIRPEHLRPLSGAGGLTFEVEWIEALGADTVLHGRVADVGDVSVRLVGGFAAQPGERLQLAVAAADLHPFDPKSGRRIPSAAMAAASASPAMEY
jgi:sn-glycerol 3-phosphate transport system ATP-binding protein